MNHTLTLLIKQLTLLVAALTSLVGSMNHPIARFGATPNVNSPSTGIVGTVPKFNSYNSQDGSFTLANTNVTDSGVGPSGVTTIAPAGTTVVNDLIQASGGFNSSFATTTAISTSTTIGSSTFCGATSILINNTVANATLTLPTAASVFTACNAVVGAFSTQWIVNDSTNTVSEVPGSGMTIRQAIVASATPITTQSSTLAATSTWQITGTFDSSSTMILSQIQFH